MSVHPLLPHPRTPAAWLNAIEVGIRHTTPAELSLMYVLRGDLTELRLPPPGLPSRTDELWRHTCCELFLALPGQCGYREYNFSPSGAWQAYDFDDYRSRRRLAAVQTPSIACESAPDCFELSVVLPTADLPGHPRLRLGLAVVVESVSGGLSYWALHHPLPEPDFHHPDAFALDLDLAP